MSTVKKFREGSMGAADIKNQKNWSWTLPFLSLVSYLIFFFDFGFLTHDYFTRAGIIWNIVAILGCGFQLGRMGYMIYNLFTKEKELGWSYWGMFALTGANWLLLGGVNFTL